MDSGAPNNQTLTFSGTATLFPPCCSELMVNKHKVLEMPYFIYPHLHFFPRLFLKETCAITHPQTKRIGD